MQLTTKGLALIDCAVTAHVENEHRILAPLKPSELAALDSQLAALLRVLEPAARENIVID